MYPLRSDTHTSTCPRRIVASGLSHNSWRGSRSDRAHTSERAKAAGAPEARFALLTQPLRLVCVLYANWVTVCVLYANLVTVLMMSSYICMLTHYAHRVAPRG